MSRSTQYIGLTKKAQEFVSNLKPIQENNFTTGMFDEEIPLGSWEHPEKGIVREVVQMEPWSSGPMIFTCLAWDFGNKVEIIEGKEQFVRDDSVTMFEWVNNPEVKDMEVDYEKGECWV